MSALIQSGALAEKLGSPSLALLDCSWYMPAENRDPRQEFAATHIPGAQFFDIDAVCDTASPYPHMLPSAEQFAQSIGKLGISNSSEVVVYDGAGLFSAARVWWMFRVFGHSNVKVLDGGLPKWKAEGRPVSSSAAAPKAATFKATFNANLLRSYEQMVENLDAKRELVLDARAAGRFDGTAPEPRPGLRSGHIPGSANIPFREFTTPPYHTLKSNDELKAILSAKQIAPEQPLVASCGSGVTACVLALALHELGNDNVAVYDGAWAQWASLRPTA